MANGLNAVTTRHRVSIAGRVQDRITAAPIGQALVQMTVWPPAFDAQLRLQKVDPARPRLDCVWSQADGIFFWMDLPPGDYALHVSVPRLGTRYGEADLPGLVVPDPVPGPAPLPARADVALSPTRITGVVRNQDTNAPIPKARVQLLGSPALTWTDSAGRFVVAGFAPTKPPPAPPAGWAPAALRLEVAAPGFAPQVAAVVPRIGHDVALDVALAPQPPTRITGVVTRQDTGDAVAKARVQLLQVDGAFLSPLAVTSPLGVYRLDLPGGARPAGPLPKLEVSAPGFHPWRQEVQPVDGGENVVDVALVPV